jgi:hypothetical protein|tara:strand:+ start:513 stop:914 length:402 start_codon:yes stop_codon:yes gene_type:complete
MTVDELVADLGMLGQELSDPQSLLTELAEPIVAEMKRRAPVDTGALRNSIGYTVNGNQIEFDMLYYGMFQNYGVKGTQDSTALPVPFGLLQPRVGNTYSFTKRRFGLRPQTFFNYDTITNTITDGIAAFTANF